MTVIQDKDLHTSLVNKVKAWRQYFNDNIERYHRNRDFIFRTTLTQAERKDLGTIQKPAMEFNVIESYMSRLDGEFSKQEPAFQVSQNPDAPYVDPRVPTILEGHLMHEYNQLRNKGVERETYRNMLTGFGVMEIYPDYDNEYTFNQSIRIISGKDPTMYGFDPMAQEKTKADGDYCFKIVPMTIEAFTETYGVDPREGQQASSSNIANYSWGLQMMDKKIVLVCLMYVKKYSYKNLVYLKNNSTLLESEYNKLLKQWSTSRIDQPSQIAKKRRVKVTTICRYDITANAIVDYNETKWRHLPYVFFDGNSEDLRQDGASGNTMQFTRPFFYHAQDAQKLKNAAGQTLANELEGIVQQKFIAPAEGIPEAYKDVYTDIQTPSNLIYNAYQEDGVTPIPPPTVVQRQMIPQEVFGTFMSADQTIQNILGSFNTQLGVDDNDISGKAIIEAMTQSNATAMPYVKNFLISWAQIANVYLSLFPMVYTTPRPLPVVDKMRNTKYEPINGYAGESPSMHYPDYALSVEVKPGVNFEVQKNRAVAQMGALAQQFQSFAQLINTKGLPILIDNLDFRGANQLKDLAIEMLQQQEQAAKAGQGQPSPAQLKMADLAMRNQHKQADVMLDMAKLKQDQMKMTMDYIGEQQDRQVDVLKAKTELAAATDKVMGEHLDRVHDMVSKGADHIHEARMHHINQMHESQEKEKKEE